MTTQAGPEGAIGMNETSGLSPGLFSLITRIRRGNSLRKAYILYTHTHMGTPSIVYTSIFIALE